ncbi:hypothetical protein EBZ80_25985 [bacterium]|nr:hypothetical protein [bacterium]
MTSYASIVFSSVDRLGNLLLGISTVMITADRLDIPLYLVDQTHHRDWFDVTGRKYRQNQLLPYDPDEERPPEPIWFRRDYDAFCSDVPLFQVQHRNVLLRHVGPLLYAGLPDPTPLPPDHLVIHVRSGDIMNDGPNHHAYIQPPLAYYRAVIDRNVYRHVTIVTEPDQRNPVLGMLRTVYKNRSDVQLTIQSASVQQDAGLVLRATHLCVGTGTFGQALSLASQHVQKLYCFATHVLFYPEADYDIRVLETVEPFPQRSVTRAEFQELCARDWTVRERDMTNFVEVPLRFWDEGR